MWSRWRGEVDTDLTDIVIKNCYKQLLASTRWLFMAPPSSVLSAETQVMKLDKYVSLEVSGRAFLTSAIGDTTRSHAMPAVTRSSTKNQYQDFKRYSTLWAADQHSRTKLDYKPLTLIGQQAMD